MRAHLVPLRGRRGVGGEDRWEEEGQPVGRRDVYGSERNGPLVFVVIPIPAHVI